jgi:hypothetical protein
VLSGSVLGSNTQGFMIRAQVARGTTFTYDAGRVIHTLLSNTGVEYILFSMDAGFTPANPGAAVSWDPFALNGLAGVLLPTGWSYGSQVLTQARTYVVPGGIADIVSLVSGAVTFQQAVLLVPEPAAGALLALGLVVAARRRAR